MESAFLLPLPFILVMFYALLVPNGKNRHVGYLGMLAGAATLVLLWFSETGVQAVSWFFVSGVQFNLSVMLDNISTLFVAVVAGIGMFVFLYSVGYFEKKEDLRRYYAVLALFAWSMIGVVISANLFQLFFCWELVGVSSYLLIGFWHNKDVAVHAARKAFLTIILGDAFLLAGILILRLHYGTFDILTLLANMQPDSLTLFAGIGIIGGAISKSAQFPLHGWLADAMAGPTPVSAFLHSATMVKAGLFLIARFLPLLVLVGLTPWLIAIAVITILISACVALVEKDIKRVLAYSTMNQLGFILLALSVGALTAGMYHVVTHSVFKALLFFAAGVAIHTARTQDMTRMRLKFGWNVLSITSFVGVAALAGIIPFAGFFSKEAIFDSLLKNGRIELVVLFSIAIILSAAYIFRWYFLIFDRKGKETRSNVPMTMPLIVLALLATLGGGMTTAFFTAWGESAPHLFSIATLVSSALVFAGFGIAFLIYVRKWNISWLSRSAIAEFCRSGFLMDNLYSFAAGIVMGIGRLCNWFDHVIDRIVRSVGRLFFFIGNILRRLETGRVTTYVLASVIGFILIALFVGVLA